MRPPRVAILAFFVSASLFIVYRSLTARTKTAAYSSYSPRTGSEKSVWSFVYYNTPFSLFPANAAISLTDDNSTSFAARPAAFGPKLEPQGLSGQLWVGSGFAEDSLDGNGELGCSDLAGWKSGNLKTLLKDNSKTGPTRASVAGVGSDFSKDDKTLLNDKDRETTSKSKTNARSISNDGTDDYLLGSSLKPVKSDAPVSSHADIQSMQEAAEIEGKVVLLMRGGCGFLEKVMWAQRRGAIGVIVGDNQKGGPLIQMFAHGDDVENVTVPSVFTARTTAHLLSSLTQPGSFIEDTLDDNGNPVLKVQQGSKPNSRQRKANAPQGGSASSAKDTPSLNNKRSASDVLDKTDTSSKAGWFSSMFGLRHSSPAVVHRSQSSDGGRLDWVLVDDWSDEKDEMIKNGMGKGKGKEKEKGKKRPQKPYVAGDDFVIGVQDWRDPDLLAKPGSASKNSPSGMNADPNTNLESNKKQGSSKNPADSSIPKGGSITPGSGYYDPNKIRVQDPKDAKSKPGSQTSGRTGKGHGGLLSSLFGDSKDEGAVHTPPVASLEESDVENPTPPDVPDFGPHDGLWVTITPTSSASPFFDTLLVLVISPLVTLTVVYALLILRARIRRRRWRAPKSVVERLPVRTYHTVVVSRSPSPRLPSPSSTSPSTPLLQQSPSRSRPRSRTTTGVMESENFLAPSAAVPTGRSAPPRQPEKGAGGFSAEWRKYMGRQVECVVCLEEYVDGVSRVMSLPCGHEFHVDCITPWLTTRRRTCPICKGDVVRSLARGPRAGPFYEPYRDDSDDEPEAEGSGNSASRTDDADLEQGILSSEPREAQRPAQNESWLSLISSSLTNRLGTPSGARSPPRSRSRSPEDRSRR